ncbi:ribosomal L7Ae/L30e/S12e/Gadd45 family protein [Clostridium sp. MD294]|uniref:L7Ae/L30e/S12e/Gadd45 family ribosomal protein n=1 Tax=Clostridium sp. MD294 TaxID=97138 RepID=UPI0002CAFC11|nr:ribosomal L7Ae/L30e/S12e/Gadd45 family protein [Clostridium sp. MD294]NDO45796.1 50S ribosomal protein L7ae [Clostridium sp. MD294]USF30549.1 putative ribosomal protein YlxQ [Clostridium sp. MD294]
MDKIYSFLGLCQKAGKVVSGEVGCEIAVRNKTAKLLLLAEDASENTQKKFQNSAAYYHIPILVLGSKQRIGMALGKESRAIIAITEEGFAKSILQKIEQ